MKFQLIGFLALLVFTQIQSDTPEEEKKKEDTISHECLTEIFQNGPRMKSGQYIEKKFCFCFAKKFGIINETGEPSIDRTRIFVRGKIPADKIEQDIQRCVEKKSTPEETAHHIIVCLLPEKMLL